MSLDELISLGEKATARPWHWWTSNSTRRLGSGDRDGNVAFGQRCSDGCPDIAISEKDMAYSEAACNAAVPLARAHQAALSKIESIRKLLWNRMGYGIATGMIVPDMTEAEARELSALLAEWKVVE